jgi:hypothetical protein
MVEAHADMVRSESPNSPTIGRAGQLGTGAPKGTTPVTVLDVLVALVSVAALIGGGAYLDHATHLAPPPGDHTPPDTPGT